MTLCLYLYGSCQLAFQRKQSLNEHQLYMLTQESYLLRNSQCCLHPTQSNSDWLFPTQSQMLKADKLVPDDSERTIST